MGVNSIKFHHRFPDEDSCYAYLSDIKWKKDMYVKSVVMNIIAKDDCLIQEDALDANTMKVVLLGLCSTNSSFRFICI